MVERSLAVPDRTWVQVDRRERGGAGTTSYYDMSETARTVAIGFTWLGRRFWRRASTPRRSSCCCATRSTSSAACGWSGTPTSTTIARRPRSPASCATREGVLRKHKQRRDGSWRDTHLFLDARHEWPDARQALERRLAR